MEKHRKNIVNEYLTQKISPMKKVAKMVISLALVAGMTLVAGTTTSCKTEQTMYRPNHKSSNTINKNYKVRGNNRNNGSTYRTY